MFDLNGAGILPQGRSRLRPGLQPAQRRWQRIADRAGERLIKAVHPPRGGELSQYNSAPFWRMLLPAR